MFTQLDTIDVGILPSYQAFTNQRSAAQCETHVLRLRAAGALQTVQGTAIPGHDSDRALETMDNRPIDYNVLVGHQDRSTGR
jgi:hypothetical protein